MKRGDKFCVFAWVSGGESIVAVIEYDYTNYHKYRKIANLTAL